MRKLYAFYGFLTIAFALMTPSFANGANVTRSQIKALPACNASQISTIQSQMNNGRNQRTGIRNILVSVGCRPSNAQWQQLKPNGSKLNFQKRASQPQAPAKKVAAKSQDPKDSPVAKAQTSIKSSGPILADLSPGEVYKRTVDGKTMYYAVNRIDQTSQTGEAFVRQSDGTYTEVQSNSADQALNVTISPCKDMSCSETQTAEIPLDAQVQSLKQAVDSKIDGIIHQKQQVAECKVDDSGDKLDTGDQMTCLANQIMNKPEKDQVDALKKVLKDQKIEGSLISDDASTRSDAQEKLNDLASAIDSDHLNPFLKVWTDFSKDAGKLLELKQQKMNIPNTSAQDRLSELYQVRNGVEAIVAKWNDKITSGKNSCAMQAQMGDPCSSYMQQLNSVLPEIIMKLGQQAETANQPNQNNMNRGNMSNRFGLNTAGRNQRTNIHTLFGNNSFGSNNRSNVFNQNRSGLNITPFNNTTAFNNGTLNNGNIFQTSALQQQRPFSQPVVNNLANSNLNFGSNSQLFSTSPINFNESQFASSINIPGASGTTIRAALRPSVNSSTIANSSMLPFCNGRVGPGYCVGGIGS